jgi:thiol:disulfide interchange protein
MRKRLICWLACGMTLALHAGSLTWLTSLPDAEAQAKKENKLVLIDVSGSDWCINCKELDEDVFQKQPFIDYARTNLVLVQVDFPHNIKLPPDLVAANVAITNQYAVKGCPTLLALNPEGAVLWNQGGYMDGGPRAVIAQLEKAKKKK